MMRLVGEIFLQFRLVVYKIIDHLRSVDKILVKLCLFSLKTF